MTAFEEFGVLPEIARAIDELDWMLPTDIQAEAIPLILGGGDVLLAAETGSGKTAAFCVPIIQIVWETLKDIESGKSISKNLSPEWTMSILDRTPDTAVSPDGLKVQSRTHAEWNGTRCTRGVLRGKWGFEATVMDKGLCRVGWSTLQATLLLGTDKFGYGFGGTGKKSNDKQFAPYGEAFGKNDVITCLIDLDDWAIRFWKNGVDLGNAFTISEEFQGSAFFPAVVLKNAEMAFNFGGKPLKYELPVGFHPVNTALKEKIVANINSQIPTIVTKQANNAPQAIIIEPSRELAEQTCTQIKNFKKYIDNPAMHGLLLSGGIDVNDQISALQEGVDIIVGTPGKLKDLIEGGYLSLANCRFLVLDEADGLLKLGFTNLIECLHKQMPKINADGHRLQMIVCSATLHNFAVKRMAEKLMHFPTWIDLKGEDTVPETVHHVVVKVDPQSDKSWHNLRQHIATDGIHFKDNVHPGETSAEALSEAVKLLKGEYCLRAINEHNMDQAIIFCRTKLDCDNLEKYMKQIDRNHYSCVCLHSDRKPHERKANLELFKQGQVKFLICTEVAARGLDITGLPFIINVTLPDEKSNYVHRIGRVGRAERMGLAISLVSTVPEKVWYHGEWCQARGRNCWNTDIVENKGCCMWYNEMQFLGNIEEHLNITIEQVEPDIKVLIDKFDGKVVYGKRKQQLGISYENHTVQMAPSVKDLSELESRAQLIYLKRHLSPAISLDEADKNGVNNSLISKEQKGDQPAEINNQPQEKELPNNLQKKPRKSRLSRTARKRKRRELEAIEKELEQFEGRLTEHTERLLMTDCTSGTVTPNRTVPITVDQSVSHNQITKAKSWGESKKRKKEISEAPVKEADSTCDIFTAKRDKIENELPSSVTQTVLESQVTVPVNIVIILEGFPDNLLSSRQMEIVNEAICEKIIANGKKGILKPKFHEFNQKPGWLALTCADRATADWLKASSAHLKLWKGAELRILDEAELPHTNFLVGSFPDSLSFSNEKILALIEAQNDLNASSWRIVKRCTNGTMLDVLLSVDSQSVDKVKKLGYIISYAFGHVELILKGKKR